MSNVSMTYAENEPTPAAVAADPPSPIGSLRKGRGLDNERIDGIALAVAAGIALTSLAFYGYCLFPGLGGELNAGDSAKFQILGHTSILVHGPGYPLILLLGIVLRALHLPFEPWWTMTIAMAAMPASFANAMAFLIVRRITGSVPFAIGGALLLGTAGLMAVQATEAEVYPLALAFILTITYLLIRFVDTERVPFFIAACGVYAISFGNHLMMIMLVGLFTAVAVTYRRKLLRLQVVAVVASFVLLGASQYLFLAYVSYHPATAWSEYMPLPPEPIEFVHYVMGTYFGDLYGSGLDSTRNAEALLATLRSAHPYVSMPLILVGLALFVAGLRRYDRDWVALAIIFGVGLSFLPFMLWYGAYDIQAFHLPLLGPLLVAATATVGWWLKGRRRAMICAATLLVVFGMARAVQASAILADREPLFTGLIPTVEQVVSQAPVENPIISMTYGLRMATLYYELLGQLPEARYELSWRVLAAIGDENPVGGVIMPTDGEQMIRWIEHSRPDLECSTLRIEAPQGTAWPAYGFFCKRSAEQTRIAPPL